MEVKTGIEGSQLSKWKIIKEEDGVRLTNLESGSQINLYSPNGLLLFTDLIESEEMKISLSMKGVYMISVKNGNNVETQKVVF